MTRPKVAIIGCGLIGALWDSPATSQAYSLTHAAGFSKHPDCDLLAFVDADLTRARAACERWHVPHAFAKVSEMLTDIQPDIVVIAAASQARMALLEPLLAAGMKLCIIEKPLASTLAESRAMVAALQASQSLSLVNYSRHWDTSLRALAQRIQAGAWGRVQRLQAWYGKGISNNGSHMIDLVGTLCAARPQRVRGRASPLLDTEAAWSEGRDVALDAQILYANANGDSFQLDLLACDQSDFTCFELRIMLQQAIIEISKGAREIAITPIVDDPNFANYRIPGERQVQAAGYLQAMDNMVKESIAIARGELTRSSCDAEDALRTALTVDAIKNSCAAGEIWLEITSVKEE
jgi:predicted dehydrogenase